MERKAKLKSSAKVPVSCNRDCGGACPLLAHIRDGRVTRITNNPLGGRHLFGCIRGFQMTETLYSPERLKMPLLRTGPRGSGSFKEIEWSQALDIVAEKLSTVRAESGNPALLPLGGSGASRGALHNTSRLLFRFMGLLGGCTEPTGSYSSAATSFASPYVLGKGWSGIDPSTLLFSNLIVLWGANIADCRFGSEMPARLREAKRKGTEIIVIDPRKTATATRLGTQWIPILPGTDTAMMMAVLYVLIEEDLLNPAFIERYSVGFDTLKRHILGLDDGRGNAKTPRWAEKICNVPAEIIAEFARKYGRTKPAAFIPGLSIQRTIGGEEAVRMAIALQVATGNLGVKGGSSGTITWENLPRPKLRGIGVPRNPAKVSVPVNAWPDAVLEGTEGGYPSDIRAIYNVGGNYLVQGSDIHKNIRAFEKVAFSVCHDYFLTPTAKHCDVVLPVTTYLEREDIVFAGGNYLLYSNQAVHPQGGARNDFHIFSELAGRLGFKDAFTEGKDEQMWLESFVEASEVPDLESFKRTGIYWGEDQMRIGLSDFISDPESHPLKTPSGRAELSSEAYARTGFSSIPECRHLPVEENYPLRLITPKSRYRVHSQNFNIPLLREREEQSLWIHPIDAGKRRIGNGQEVVITSPEGRVRIIAHVTEDMMPGVVCLLEGAWPSFEPDGTDRAGSSNVLTSTVPTKPSQGSRTHSVLVEVTSIETE
jgi:anaerobic dimethyl sulfoxide reductase subunit A